MNTRSWHVSVRVVAILAAVAVAASVAPALAQSGGSKDTKKLREKVETARKDVQSTEDQIKGAMDLYNALIGQTAKKPESTYKKLDSAVGACDKAAKAAGKSVQAMQKDMGKLFAAWEQEISGYSSESLKSAAQKSYDDAKGKLDRFNQALTEAADMYHPFIADLGEQAQYMGRDLSPDGMAALADPAKALNEKAEALYAKIDQALNDTEAAADEAEAAEGHDTETEAPADEDSPPAEGEDDAAEAGGDDTESE